MKPLFDLGEVRATPGVLEVIDDRTAAELIRRHASGDFGCVDEEDQQTNREAVESGERILSAYPIDPAKPCAGFGTNCIWIITEAQDDNGLRSATTILLPDEY